MRFAGSPRRALGVAISIATLASIAFAVMTPDAVGSRLPPRLGKSAGPQYFVDGQRGLDSNRGSRKAPWKTIAKAWRSARPGSTINVRGGSYLGQVSLTHRASTRKHPITVRAYPGETVRLTNDVSWYPVVFVGNSVGVRVQGFTMSNPVGDCVKVSNASDIEISDNTMVGCNMMGVIVGGSGSTAPTYSRNVQIWNNRFYAGGGYWPDNTWKSQEGTHSIYYGNVSSNTDGIRHGAVGGVIANNLFYNKPTGYHLEIGSQNDGLIVTNNTFDNNYATLDVAGNAIQLYSEANAYVNKNIVIANNIISNSSHRGIYGSGPTMINNIARHNLAFNNPAGDLVSSFEGNRLFSLGAGNITDLDPRYVDQAANDYRLRPTSPAIGAADPAYAPATDFTGKRRDAAPDIGAFEYRR